MAVVDKIAAKRGTTAQAQPYLQYLYSPAGQERSRLATTSARVTPKSPRYAKQFTKLELFTIDELFGGWRQAQKTHFDDGGVFDRSAPASR